MPNNPTSSNELNVSAAEPARPMSIKSMEIMAKLSAVRGKINGAYTDNQEVMPQEIDRALEMKLKELQERAMRREVIREALMSGAMESATTVRITPPAPETSSTSSASAEAPSIPLPPTPEATCPPAPQESSNTTNNDDGSSTVVEVAVVPPPAPLTDDDIAITPSPATTSTSSSEATKSSNHQKPTGTIEDFFSSADKGDQDTVKRPPMPRMSLGVVDDNPSVSKSSLLRKAEQQVMDGAVKPAPLVREGSGKKVVATEAVPAKASSSSSFPAPRQIHSMRAVGAVVVAATNKASSTATPSSRPKTSTPSSSSATTTTRPPLAPSSRPLSSAKPLLTSRSSSGSTTRPVGTMKQSSSSSSLSNPAAAGGGGSNASPSVASVESTITEEQIKHIMNKDLNKDIENLIASEAKQEEKAKRLSRLTQVKPKPTTYKIAGVPDGHPAFAGAGSMAVAGVAVVKFKKAIEPSSTTTRPATASATSASSSSVVTSSLSRPSTAATTSTTMPTQKKTAFGSTTSIPSSSSAASSSTSSNSISIIRKKSAKGAGHSHHTSSKSIGGLYQKDDLYS